MVIWIGVVVDGCRESERSNKGKGPHVREYFGASGIHAAMQCCMHALRAPGPGRPCKCIVAIACLYFCVTH